MREDTYEDIQRCLSCKFPRCINCLDHRGVQAQKDRKRMDRVQELYDKGLNDESIARLLGVSRSHVSKLRREIGLPARRERHPYGPRQPKTV